MEPDPFQPGHMLVGIGSGMYLTGEGYLYSSTDYGATWQQVAMPQTVDLINDIAFDPVTPGLVYLTTMGTGVYRSTDHGSDTGLGSTIPKSNRTSRPPGTGSHRHRHPSAAHGDGRGERVHVSLPR